MFLLTSPDEDMAFKEVQLITYALIKMSETSLYAKAMDLWNRCEIANRKT